MIYVPMTQQRIQFKFHQNIAVLPDWQIVDAGTMIEMLALSKNYGLHRDGNIDLDSSSRNYGSHAYMHETLSLKVGFSSTFEET